jgi:hypothetical protein
LADQVNTSYHPRMLGAGGAFGIDMRQMRRVRPSAFLYRRALSNFPGVILISRRALRRFDHRTMHDDLSGDPKKLRQHCQPILFG